MEVAKKRVLARARKKGHVRKKISGTEQRPRVSVFRSAKHIYAQAIDDVSGATLVSLSSLDKEVKVKINGLNANNEAAGMIGKAFGEKLSDKGLKEIVFDRNGYLYHGRVKSLADGIREAGIKF